MLNPKYSPFDRWPPADLEDDGISLSEVLCAMSVTASILEAFGYKQRPLGRWRRFVWDSPQRDNGKPRATIETSDSCAVSVTIETSDAGLEAYTNDLELFLRLTKLHHKCGIGRPDAGLLVEAVKSLVLTAAGHDPAAMPAEAFAMIVEGQQRDTI